MTMTKQFKPFRLTRAYSIVSLIGIFVVTIFMTYNHRTVSTKALLDLQTDFNVDLTRAVSNSIWNKYIEFFNQTSEMTPVQLKASPELKELDVDLKRQMRGLRVVKIKIYNRHGLTVFSTEASQIGEDKSANQGFISALNGQVTGEVTFRDKFNAFDMVIEDRNLLSSYIPVRYGPNDEIVAVFELYSDITSLLEEVEKTEFELVALGSSLMLILYAFLLIYVRRADRIIKNHEDEQKRIQQEHIRYISDHDYLTGLPSRNFFIQLLDKAIDRARESNKNLVIFLIDIDRFKLINDNLGQEIGDKVLTELVARISSLIPDTSIFGRIGGDEFVIAVDNFINRKTESLASNIISHSTLPYNINENEIILSVSLGISVYPDAAHDAEDALKCAEAANLRAKELGRNRYAYFTEELNIRAIERFELEHALTKAIDNNEFDVFYQPRIDASTGLTVGAEALLRWRRSNGTLVSPLLFISTLEDMGLIIPLGEWVLKTACTQCKNWHELGFTNLHISVNLSMRQFQSGNLLEIIRKALLESGLDANYLELELTESLLASDQENVLSILKTLKALGTNLSIDDFGTGYSSLSYLMNFPLDCLKIDQSFVRDAITNSDHANLTATIVNMAKGLRMKTVAEGVETIAHKEFVTNLGCDELQGYHFSKPLPAAEFHNYLQTRNASELT